MSFNQKLQKYIEKCHLKYFLSKNIGKDFLKSLSSVGIIPSEAPDFIIKTKENKLIGLEETIIGDNHPIIRFYNSLDAVVKSVFKKLDTTFKNKFFINLICLETDISKVKFSKEKLSEQIFNIIKKKPDAPTVDNSYEYMGLKVTGKHNIVKFITENNIKMQLIYSPTDSDYHFGGTPVVSFPIKKPIELVEMSIKNKENKCKSYKKNIPECNLLIIYDPFLVKGLAFNVSDDVYNHVFATSFENIFLMELGGQENIKVTKLKTVKND